MAKKTSLPKEERQQPPERSLGDDIASAIAECAEDNGKQPQDIIWHDFREFIGQAYGKNSQGLTPRDITRAGGFYAIRDAYYPPVPTEQNKRREEIKGIAAMYRKGSKDWLWMSGILDKLESFADRVFSGKVVPSKTPKSKKKVERVLTAMLSDLHIGSDISDDTTGHVFGRVEEARRLAAIVKQIGEYKLQYRDETTLNLLLLGDVIENLLHDMRDGAAIAEQAARAIHLLVQAIAHLAAKFRKVDVYCATGNHGRNTARHPKRATHGKWDSLETMIYYAVMKAVKHLPNVTFHIPKTPYVIVPMMGYRGFFTHGDGVLKPGNPGSSLNIKGLEEQINKINASLPDDHEYAVVGMGHVHVGTMTCLSNGTVVLTNPPLVPPNEFAESIGILEAQCAQWLFETVKGHPVGDARLMRVDKDTDRDESLDEIIQAWKSLEE